ncbi:MATE family efflux transporter [Aquimarina agarivorans]|uniref:MATE family efflux transporter n=1 Tax=Aquimarina agarivorans TaxID=980584 RepID=UPI000248FD76|nr:MATE family efflux transporter [Aquimarina agarivorans]
MFSKYVKEFPTNLSLAYPVMIGQLGNVLVGFVDNVMVGKLGASALAAVSLGNGLFFLTLSLAIGFSLIITPLVAEADAQNNQQKIRSLLKNGLVLCTLTGGILFVVIKLLQPFLEVLDQPVDVVALANPYINILAFSIVPLAIFQGLKQFSDGLSATRYAMVAAILGNVVNIFFNYVLIYGKWGFPKLLLEGAALGTLIARILMVLLMVFLFYYKQNFRRYLNDFFKKLIDLDVLKKLVKLGLPVALQMLFEFGIFVSSVFLSGSLSTEDQAANQIALNIASVTFMIAVGLGVAATIRTGNQVGKKDAKSLMRITSSILLLVFLIELVFAIFLIATKSYLPTFYIHDKNVIHIAAQLLVVVACFQISDGFQVVLLGTLRGLQDVNVPTLCLFFAYWCVGFPISYFLGSQDLLGSTGIWVGLFAGLSTSSLLLYLRYSNLMANRSLA